MHAIQCLHWFFHVDSLFEGISLVIGLLLFVFAYHAYKLTGHTKYRAFAGAFLSISLGFIVKIITNTLTYANHLIKEGSDSALCSLAPHMWWWQPIGNVVHSFLLLWGFLLLATTALKIEDDKILFLLTYFVSLVAAISLINYFFFYLTLGVLISVLVYNHSRVCCTSPKAKLVMYAFVFLFFAQLVFILNHIHPIIYVIGELLQLMGFILLLITYIMVLRK